MVAFRNANGKTCGGGSISMLQIQPASLSEAWCAALNGGGAPIITTTDGVQNPIVWAVGAGGDNLLHGFDALNGTVVFSGTGTSMSGLRNFATILVGGGKFYVAGQGKIYAFTY
jgi:Ca2+-binding RTX toxin-like protein